MTFEAFGANVEPANTEVPSSGHLALSDAFDSALNPAPVTPTTGSGAWELLSGSILFEFKSSPRGEIRSKPAAVAPGLSLGELSFESVWRIKLSIAVRNIRKHWFVLLSDQSIQVPMTYRYKILLELDGEHLQIRSSRSC